MFVFCVPFGFYNISFLITKVVSIIIIISWLCMLWHDLTLCMHGYVK